MGALNEIGDGGPAFPAEGGSDSGLHPAAGMSLRDYFAAQEAYRTGHMPRTGFLLGPGEPK